MTASGTPSPTEGRPEVIQLSHRLDPSTPRSLAARPFEHVLTDPHAPFAGPSEPITEGTPTSASDWIGLGSHVGTHIDSLSHVARGGKLHDGTLVDAPGRQSKRGGVRMDSGTELRPVVVRGVLLDLPGFGGVDRIAGDTRLTPADLGECAAWAGVDLRPGDGVLIRTGWDTLAADPQAFTALPLPGPELEAARWLAALPASVVGSDTMPFEAAPGEEPLAVHAALIADHGIQIMEMLDLRELAQRRLYEFTLVVAPLRVVGGTGSPVNPLAIVGS